MRRRIAGFLACILCCAAAQAAPKSTVKNTSPAPAPAAVNMGGDYHLCTDQDLIGGTWKLVLMQQTPPSREADYYRNIRYQYLGFYPNHLFSLIASNREIMKPIDVRKLMERDIMRPQRARNPKMRREPRYSLDDKGILGLYRGKKTLYSFRCTAVNNTQGTFVKGDIILTGYTRKKKTELYELFRRWF